MRKRILTMLLAMLLIVASLPLETFASTEENIGERTNMELLNSVLQERPWVIETLIDGDVTNNPYAIVQAPADNEPKLLINEVLENYNNNTAFRAVVNAMEIYSNTGDYVSGFSHETLETAMDWLSVDTEDKARVILDELVASVDELKFESVLNEIIKADFTASWGEAVIDADINLENLRQRAKAIKKAKKFQKEIKKIVDYIEGDKEPIYIDLSSTESLNSVMNEEIYAGLLLSAYQTDLNSYVENVIEISSEDNIESLERKIIATYSLSDISTEEITIVNSSSDIEIEETFTNIMCENTFDAVKTSGKILKIGSFAMNYAVMLESLTNQAQSLSTTLDYIADNTEITDLKTVLNRYSSLVKDEGNQRINNYEEVISYVRNETVITDFITKKLKEKLKESLGNYYVFYKNASGQICASSIATVLAKIGLVVDIAVWLGNKTVGIQDTSKKIFLCKYVDKVAEETATICQADLNDYRNNPTEESAEKIINELDFLKKTRLYGEELAYESVEYQVDSWLGKLLSNGCEQEQWEKWHQAAIDLLIGCSSLPMSGNALKLSKGETLTIEYCDLKNGNETLVGRISGGRNCSFAEADLRLMGGVELNDSSLKFHCGISNDAQKELFKRLFIPSVATKGTSDIFVNNGNINFGEITNEGELTIKLGSDSACVSVYGATTNTNVMNISCETEQENGVSTYDLENTSSIQIENTSLQVKGNLNNAGDVKGKTLVCGNGERSYSSSLLTYAPKQIIAGSGTISDLYINSTAELGVNVTGKQTITNVFSNPSTIIHNAKRLTVTGNCEIDGGYCYSGLTFRDYTTSQIVVLEGTGYICGDVTFGGNTIFLDGLDVTSECNTLNLGSFTRVAGDFVYESGTISGERLLHLCGDVNIKTQTPSLKYISLEGANPQTIQSTNALDLEELRNDNTSSNGVLIDSQIKVSDLIYTGSNALYRQGKNIILTSNAKADGDSINGSISALDWTCSNPIYITGTIFVSGSNAMQNGGSIQTNNYKQTSGSMEIADEGQIVVENDATINGSVTGGTIEVKGDIVAGAVINIGKLIMNGKTPQSFTNTASTIAKALAIDNNSKGGVTINSIINVTEQFKNNCKNLINGKKIQVGALSELEMKELAKGDMTVSDSWNIASGKEYTIPGTLNLLEGSTVTLQEGSVLSIDGNMVNNKASIVIKQGAVLNVTEYTNCASGSITIEDGGTLYLGSDAKLSSTTIGGDGLLVVCGDLYNKNCTWNTPNLKIAGKVPQSISGDNISANDLILGNSSKSGITLLTKLQYQGEKQCNEGKVNGSDKISVMS